MKQIPIVIDSLKFGAKIPVMASENCPIYDRLKASFHIRQDACQNAVKLDPKTNKLVAYCPKTRKGCFALADLQAEAKFVPEEEDLPFVDAIRQLEEKAVKSSSQA